MELWNSKTLTNFPRRRKVVHNGARTFACLKYIMEKVY